jgi:hypothetical protein
LNSQYTQSKGMYFTTHVVTVKGTIVCDLVLLHRF